jgi:hypothetical protein
MAVILTASLLGLLLSSCSREKKHEPQDPSQVKVEKTNDPNVIEVDHPEQFSVVRGKNVLLRMKSG